MTTVEWTEPRVLAVPLTAEELQEAGDTLARTLRTKGDAELEEGERRKAFKQTLEALDHDIAHYARLVIERSRQEPVDVVLRYDAAEDQLTAIRADLGEVLYRRRPTKDERATAAMTAEAQRQRELQLGPPPTASV